MIAYVAIATQDGTYIVRDPFTGLSASGATLQEALAELRRLRTSQVAA